MVHMGSQKECDDTGPAAWLTPVQCRSGEASRAPFWESEVIRQIGCLTSRLRVSADYQGCAVSAG